MIQRLELKNFTVFESLEIDFSPGVNIFIGENGTGKTHVLKLMYSVLASCFQRVHPGTKLKDVFRPEGSIQRLVRRELAKPVTGTFMVGTDTDEFTGHIEKVISKTSGFLGFDAYVGAAATKKLVTRPIYIPPKEILAEAAKTIALEREWELPISAVEIDYISTILLPERKTTSPLSLPSSLLKRLIAVVGGSVIQEEDRFYIREKAGKCEFSLVAEGHRKLAALSILMQKNLIDNNTIIFWDEPENNMNPKLLKFLVELLIELQRSGVQIFLATHSYALLKLFDLLKRCDNITYHHFKSNPVTRGKKVEMKSSDDSLIITESSISETYLELYDMEVERAFSE